MQYHHDEQKKIEKKIIDTYGKKYIKRLEKIGENIASFDIVGIVDKPQGEKKECEYGWKHKWMDEQTGGGYTGDMFGRFAYYELPGDKYIKVAHWV